MHKHYCWSCERTWECGGQLCKFDKEITCPLCDKELDGDEIEEYDE